MVNSQCKICRRAGLKLFLKGDKCLSPKCTLIKRSYPPGQIKKRRPTPLSEYGKELREKQKLKNWYNLKEHQFKNYVKKALSKRGSSQDPTVLLIKSLEGRLDNTVFRLGFASSRAQARQLVSHRHFLVNGRPTNAPSHQVKKGDIITLSARKVKKAAYQNIQSSLKKHKPPSWLELNVEKLEGKVRALPTLEEAAPPAELSAIFEFYSR